MQEMIRLGAAFLGSLGFAALFNVRGEKLIYASLGGLLSWGVYLYASTTVDSPYFCGFIASVLLTFYAECMARIQKTPVTVFLVSAAIPLFPGAGLYRAMSCFVARDWNQFSTECGYTFLFAASMSAGITLTTIIYRMIKRCSLRRTHI